MLRFEQHQEGLARRLFVIGVPTQLIKPFVAELVKWEHHSGVEWTIKRLKSLKVDLIRRRSGLAPLTWIRKNRKGDVAGVVGSILRWSDRSVKEFERAIQAFMAYSYYILPELTDSQKEKFLKGINCSDEDGLDDSFLRGFRETVVRVIGRRAIITPVQPLVSYEGSPSKRAPALFGRESLGQDEDPLRDAEFFNLSDSIDLYLRYRGIYSSVLEGLARRDYLDSCLETYRRFPRAPKQVLGGRIAFIQEPGGKLRSVASPFRVHQLALGPLGRELYSIVSQLPWDCTFDQSKAFPAIQSHLKAGEECHSIDLSSATDIFPLSLQLVALSAIFGKENPYVNLFAEISRGKWDSPIGVLSWKRGQPLGLFPSFGSFTLTHGLLLLHLNGGQHNGDFFIVGDDVVILKRKLKEGYVSMLDRMHCPWSTDKSIDSNKLCEFAGKIIHPLGVIPQLKWRRMSDDNFLDICRLLGRGSRSMLTWRQRRVYDAIAHLCEPIGLNQSLPGDNLVSMTLRTLAFFKPEEVVLGALMGLRGRIHRNAYTTSTIEKLVPSGIQLIMDTFDEKVKCALAQTVFSRWESSILIGLDGLSSVPLALRIFPRLPVRGVPPGRRSTLERYESIIRQSH